MRGRPTCYAPPMQHMERHFTVTGFVSHEDRTALHWHWLGMWLPPGGHIHPNEDPIEAVLREVREETGLAVEVIPTAAACSYRHPRQLPTPVTIGVYDIDAPGQPHQHIDLVYFTRPVPGQSLALPSHGPGWRWVSEDELRAAAPLPLSAGGEVVPAEDVRTLGCAAIEAARRLTPAR